MIQRLFFELFYFRRPPWDTGISPPELMAYINTHQPGRALDLGCGTGTNAITLARLGWQVVGVDYVGRAVRAARRKAREAGVQVDFRIYDVTRLRDISGLFDLVLDIGCFHSLSSERKEAYIANLARLLAPEGTFLVYGFTVPNGSTQNPGLTPVDITKLSNHLRLVQRVDGADRGERASAWLTFQK